MWELARRRKVWRASPAALVRALAFSPDSTRLALVTSSAKRDQDNELQVRWTQGGGLAFPARHPGSLLTTIAYSPDSMTLLVAGGDGVVRTLEAVVNGLELLSRPIAFRRVWPHGTHARLVPLGSERDYLALISPDGSQLAFLPALQGGGPIVLPAPDNATLLALAYETHTETLATACEDGTVRLWSARPPYQITSVLRGHKGAVTGVTFSRDGSRLASCGADGTVRIWDLEQAEELLTIEGYSGAIGVVFGHDDNRILFDKPPSLVRLAIIHGKKVTVLAPPVLVVEAQ